MDARVKPGHDDRGGSARGLRRGAAPNLRRRSACLPCQELVDALPFLLEGGELGALQLAPARHADLHAGRRSGR